MTSYTVLAPYVTIRVKDQTSGKDVLLGYYAGAPVPGAANAEDVARLVRKGMLAAEVTDEAADEPTQQPQGGDRPHGNASRETWAAYAASKGAPEDETKPVDEGGLNREDLRARYGN